MKLKIIEFLPGEIAHHYEPATGFTLFSQANRFWGTAGLQPFDFAIPVNPASKLKAMTRLSRRLTRTDKSTAAFSKARDGVVILYLGNIYLFLLRTSELKQVGSLQQCRNILHGGVAVTDHGIYFGEYGANPKRESVPLWVSKTDGRSWEIAHRFPAGSIKHVHGVYADPYSDSLWVPTGDFAGECGVFEAPGGDFSRLRRHGDGNQRYRPVSMFFDPERIVWGMDSQLETSYLQTLDRATGELAQGCAFPGPVWYAKRFDDGRAILQTTVEIGPGSQSDYSHLFASDNLSDWQEIGRFRKDIYPKRTFKFGVIAFADGHQSSSDFVLFGEALSGLDGRIARVALQ